MCTARPRELAAVAGGSRPAPDSHSDSSDHAQELTELLLYRFECSLNNVQQYFLAFHKISVCQMKPVSARRDVS